MAGGIYYLPNPYETVTVLSEAYFTHLACNEPVEGLMTGEIPTVKLSKYIEKLNWWRRYEYHYMEWRARTGIWIQKELFRRIARFHDTK